MFLDDFYPLPGPAAATSARCRPRTPRPSQRGCRGRPAGWMNGGGGCEVYWLLTWVGNSNHPSSKCQTNRIQWLGTKDGVTFLFFNEQFDGPSETSFSVGRSNTSGILSKTLPKQRLEEEIISNKQMSVIWKLVGTLNPCHVT